MLGFGFLVALGLLLLYARLGWRGRIWLNSHPLLVDVAVFVLLNVLHWGTFSGLMVAAIGATISSLFLSTSRRLFGYVEGEEFVKGAFDVSHRLSSD